MATEVFVMMSSCGMRVRALSLSASHINFCLRILLGSVQHDGGEVTWMGALSMECLCVEIL